MSEIQFPLNRKRYFDLGQEALAAGHVQKAADYFQKSYDEKPDFSMNLLLTTTLLEAGRAAKAYEVASDFVEQHLSADEFFSLYLQCLLANHYFLKAHQLVNEKLHGASGLELKKMAHYKKVIRQKELIYQQLVEREVEKNYERLMTMPEHAYIEQLELAKIAQVLPQEEFYRACQQLFLDERVHYLVKALLLEELVQLRLQKKIDLLYRNQNQRSIWLPDLLPITATPLFEKLTLILAKEAGHVDPILEANVLEEMRLSYALLYPFEADFITNPKAWVLSYLTEYNAQFLVGLTTAQRREVLQLGVIQAELKKDLARFQASGSPQA